MSPRPPGGSDPGAGGMIYVCIYMYGGSDNKCDDDMRESGAIEPKIMNYEVNSRIHFIISKVCLILMKI